ncbi:MAG: DUF3017 domain-containing protein [Nostocoides sp.]
MAPETEPRPPVAPGLGVWWIVAVGLVGGVAFSATDHHLRATVMLSGSCLLAGVLRAVLPQRRAGGLVVRRQWLDVAMLVALGVAVGVIGRSMNLHPHL